LRDGGVDWRGGIAAALAIGVMPIAAVLALVAGVAMLGLGMAGLFMTVMAFLFSEGRAAIALVALWCWAGSVACAYATVTAVEALGALDWRPLPRLALILGMVVLLYPGLWLPGGVARLGMGA
jgi:hypothetical protein